MSFIINPFLFATGGGFTPASISDLQLWLSGDNVGGASDGGKVHPWPDQSGNARDAFQSVPDTANQATYHATGGPNNKPYLSFDGNDSYVLPNFMTGYTVGHVFIIVKAANDPAATTGTCIGAWGVGGVSGDGNGGNTLYPFTNGVIHDGWGSTTRTNTGDPTPALNVWRLYEVLSKSANWTSWIDGAQHFTTATNTVGFPALPRIGHDNTGNFFLGDCAEIVFYSRDINATEIQQIKDYLADKYALTIA